MPFKPNFNFQRAERDRLKKEAKEAKLRDRKEQAALRKANEAKGEAPAGDPPESAVE